MLSGLSGRSGLFWVRPMMRTTSQASFAPASAPSVSRTSIDSLPSPSTAQHQLDSAGVDLGRHPESVFPLHVDAEDELVPRVQPPRGQPLEYLAKQGGLASAQETEESRVGT